MEDKRHDRRIRFERPARITTSVGEKSSVRSYDFSRTGAGFICDAPLKIGESLSMILDIGKKGQSQIMRIRGEVVHQSQKHDTYLMGMRFSKK
ncbi:MAG: PilZ domain-containing protein [Gammaproteobacteria bacterium]|nr:PilZ domain-containing protein [Gammaproteobacteria bacterium]MDH5778882.1 PilZ domain-containing protein [Gammaproteobacteria bacterium]